MSGRRLWKIVYGEGEVKVYSLYLPAERFIEIWVDNNRDGSGWQLYERIHLDEEAKS